MATGAPRPAPPLPALRARLRGRASLLERRERGPSATKMVGAVGGKRRGGQETREFALSLPPPLEVGPRGSSPEAIIELPVCLT